MGVGIKGYHLLNSHITIIIKPQSVLLSTKLSMVESVNLQFTSLNLKKTTSRRKILLEAPQKLSIKFEIEHELHNVDRKATLIREDDHLNFKSEILYLEGGISLGHDEVPQEGKTEPEIHWSF